MIQYIMFNSKGGIQAWKGERRAETHRTHRTHQTQEWKGERSETHRTHQAQTQNRLTEECKREREGEREREREREGGERDLFQEQS